MHRYLQFFVLIFCLGAGIGGQAQQRGLSFVPDHSFSASTLTGWKTFGTAIWRASNGEISTLVQPGKETGWLVMQQAYQDAGFHALIKATPEAEAGILFRMETKGDSISGILVAVKGDSFSTTRIQFDPSGRIVQRTVLPSAGSIVRIAPPADPQAQAGRNRSGGMNRAAGPDLPLVRPSTAWRAGEWNQIEIFIDANIIRSFINDGRENGAATADDGNGFGPIALYASGSGEAAFKDIRIKDIAVKTLPVEQSAERYRVQRINDMYYSWGAAAADFNKDGHTDIVSGPYVYWGPDYTRSREIYIAATVNASKEFTEINCQYTFDFNKDGYPDILTGPPRATVYLNPGKASRRWQKSEVITAVQTEITLFKDIDADGVPELIFGTNGALCYAKPPGKDTTQPWTIHAISAKGYSMAHGLGAGDINGDGRIDILNPNGWWEQPAQLTDSPWTYHAVAFARYGHRSTGAGGSTMGIYDVNGDKLNDVVTALNAHGFGLAWYEQKRDAAGNISFVQHIISDDYSTINAGNITFSQIHGAAFADIDGDGVTDLIAGKRCFSHLDNFFDPDPYGAPVIYCYRTVRNPKAPGGAEFIPELVHNRSGAGSDILVADLNKDGFIDIVTATNRGTFIFWNRGRF